MTASINEFDVVVVGAGIAGLSAALSAYEAGARVAIIDRAPASVSGGNTRYTEAFLRMKSLDEPSEDLAERLLDDFQGHPDPGILMETLADRKHWDAVTSTLNVVDHGVVTTLLEQAGPTLRWLTGFGVSFSALPTPFPTTSTSRMAPVGGGLALIEALTKAVIERRIVVHFETPAQQLAVHENLVAGVTARTAGGSLTLLGQVVLACGGYEGNPEMLARYHGDKGMLCRPVARGGHYNKGEGIEMALSVGATTAGNFSLFHAEPVDPRSGEAEAAIFAFPYGILVNSAGKRFADEAPGPSDAWYERVTRIIHSQSNGIAYLILNHEAQQVPNLSASIRTDQPPIVAAGVDELAAALGMPPATLRETMDAFDRACRPGRFDHSVPDGLSTEGLVPAKSNWARPVGAGPFHAYPIMAPTCSPSAVCARTRRRTYWTGTAIGSQDCSQPAS